MFSLMPWRREKAEHEVVPREYTPLEVLRREFAPLFARAFPGLPIPWEYALEGGPRGIDVEEKDGEVVVRVEVPGFDPKELEVSIRDTSLIVRGEHKETTEGKEGESVRRIERVVTLPDRFDPEKIEALCRNGVLEVRVPRTPEAKPRRIEVKT